MQAKKAWAIAGLWLLCGAGALAEPTELVRYAVTGTAAEAHLAPVGGDVPEEAKLARHGAPAVAADLPNGVAAKGSLVFAGGSGCYAAEWNPLPEGACLVEAWLKADAANDPHWNVALAIGGQRPGGITLLQNGSSWMVMNHGGSRARSRCWLSPVQAEKWTHFVIVRDKNGLDVWVDGRRQLHNKDVHLARGAESICIGAMEPGKHPFTGRVALVRVAALGDDGFDPVRDLPAYSDHLLACRKVEQQALAAAEIARKQWLAQLAADGHRATNATMDAFCAYKRSQAVAQLAADGDLLPDDFLDWIDRDPMVRASVYGIRDNPANVLRTLRSLEIDLGEDLVRREYLQLALAYVVSNASGDSVANLGVDLRPRPPLELKIPENPLRPIDTKDPNRTLDAYDHVVNFLNDHTLTYQRKTTENGVTKMVTKERSLIGADVIRHKEWQEKFNAYMAEKGHPEIAVDCPPPSSHPQQGKTMQAAELFHDAYVAKGLLPEARDPNPTLAEAMAWYVRNDRFRFPEDSDRRWPAFELKERPWPTMTFLTLQRMPLRELEDMWQRWVETGRQLAGGVRYVGYIAQKGWLLRGASMAPFDFYYGSAQMNVRDGGVCGAQSNTWAMTSLVLGRPATVTLSSTHCGTIAFDYNPETGLAKFGGAKVPNTWIFSNPPMAGGQSDPHCCTAAGVNYGYQAYLESYLIHAAYQELPEDVRSSQAAPLLQDALLRNPFNYLVNATMRKELDPYALYQADRQVREELGADFFSKPGCAERWYRLPFQLRDALARDEIPEDPERRRQLYAYLQADERADEAALARYQAAVEGTTAVTAGVEDALRGYLAGDRDPKAGRELADQIGAAARQLADNKARRAWGEKLAEILTDRELALRPYKRQIQIDPCTPIIFSLAGRPKADLQVLLPPLLTQLRDKAAALAAAPEVDDKQIAEVRTDAHWVLPQIQDEAVREAWRRELVAALSPRAELWPVSQTIAKMGWKVTALSGQGTRHPWPHAFDGNPNSFWYSLPTADDARPHLVVDMNAVRTIAGFTYLPRPKDPAGMVDACELHVSLDGESWQLAGKAAWPDVSATPADPQARLQTLRFPAVQARFFKFVATHAVDDKNHAIAAELGVIPAEDDADRLLAELATRATARCVDNACVEVLGRVQAIAEEMADDVRRQWLSACADALAGSETCTEKQKGGAYAARVSPLAAWIHEQIARPLPPEPARWLPLTERLADAWRAAVAERQDAAACQDLLAQARAVAPMLPDRQRTAWLEQLHDATMTAPTHFLYADQIGKLNWRIVSVTCEKEASHGRAANLIDDLPGTYWHTSRERSPQLAFPQHIVIDLGANRAIDGMDLCLRRNTNSGLVNDFALYLSDDGENWRTALEKKYDTIPLLRRGPSTADALSESFPATSGRYVKLEVRGSLAAHHLVVCELGLREAVGQRAVAERERALALWRDHLAKDRSAPDCRQMLADLQATATRISDEATRTAWLTACLKAAVDREAYLGPRNVLTIDPAAEWLREQLAKPLPEKDLLAAPHRKAVTQGWRAMIADGKFDGKAAGVLYGQMNALHRQTDDETIWTDWRAETLALFDGVEDASFQAWRQKLSSIGWKPLLASNQLGKVLAIADGNARTAWNDKAPAAGDPAAAPQFAVDMGVVGTLAGFTCQPASGRGVGSVKRCAFFVSLDGKQWQLVARADFADTSASRTVTFPAIQARCFKVVFDGLAADEPVIVPEFNVAEQRNPDTGS